MHGKVKKLSALFTSMSEMVVLHELVFDGNGIPVNYRITDCNEAFTRITGITRNAAVGRLATEVYGTGEPPYLEKYTKVALTGEPHHYETYFQPMDKHFSISVIRPEKNHFATVTTDINEHKQYELLLQEKSEEIAAQNEELAVQNEELNKANRELIAAKEKAEESEGKLKEAQCIALMGNWELNIATNELFWSDEIFRIFDCEPHEFNATYESFLEFIHPDDREKVNSAYANALEAKTGYQIEHRLITKSHQIKYVREKCTTTFNEQGKPLYSFGIVIDITEQKALENALIKAKEKAEESERLKTAFLANMSHEIRTPMNGILGFADLLKEPNLSGDKQKKYIGIIEKSGERMLNIINDIIDISKIESGLMNLDMKETNVNEQIEFIYNFFQPEAKDKGIKLSFKNPLPAKEATIKTDREKLYAILTNLAKNALKYTEKGSIELGYHLKTDSEPGELKFYVKDTGIGISRDRQEVIFERFIQSDIADDLAHQGAGLGLAISKAYLEMLGGKIWVESEDGKGTTFFFTLPYNTKTLIETIDRQHTPLGENKTVIKLKILIAEDDEVSEMLLDETVKMFGKEILKARTGVEAVEVCRYNPDIDLILMDINMPAMGGYEATQQIREFNKEVIIIAQTAYGLTGDREKSLESGCNDYITKPINKNNLLALIQKYFGKCRERWEG